MKTNLRILALASLLAPVPHAATTVYDVPSTAITYGNRYQYDPIATPAQTSASWAGVAMGSYWYRFP